MTLKGLLVVAGMMIGPFAAGYVNHDLQVLLIGIDIGIIGTFAYTVLALLFKVKKMGKALEEEMKKAGIKFEK